MMMNTSNEFVRLGSTLCRTSPVPLAASHPGLFSQTPIPKLIAPTNDDDDDDDQTTTTNPIEPHRAREKDQRPLSLTSSTQSLIIPPCVVPTLHTNPTHLVPSLPIESSQHRRRRCPHPRPHRRPGRNHIYTHYTPPPHPGSCRTPLTSPPPLRTRPPKLKP